MTNLGLGAVYVESLMLTHQCHFLESSFQSNFTSEVLTSSDNESHSYIKKEILCHDYFQLLAEGHPSQKHVASVATDVSWLKLWDMTLDKGVFGTTSVQVILQCLSLHGCIQTAWPMLVKSHHVQHFLSTYSNLVISPDSLIVACVNLTDPLTATTLLQ